MPSHVHAALRFCRTPTSQDPCADPTRATDCPMSCPARTPPVLVVRGVPVMRIGERITRFGHRILTSPPSASTARGIRIGCTWHHLSISASTARGAERSSLWIPGVVDLQVQSMTAFSEDSQSRVHADVEFIPGRTWVVIPSRGARACWRACPA